MYADKEKQQRYDRERYLTKRKPLRFGNRICKCCEVLLASREGGHFSRSYCRRCKDNGDAQRHGSREYYVKNFPKVCEICGKNKYRSVHRACQNTITIRTRIALQESPAKLSA